MSKATKSEDSLLEERIEKIRRNNERIQRRHLEVEADKQNAAKLNALVQLSPPPDDDDDDEPRFSHPRLPKKADRDDKVPDEQINYPSRNSACGYNRPGPSSQPYTGSKTHSLPQNGGPPPDPVYNFLADRERDPITNSRIAHFQRGGNRGGRGAPGQYRTRSVPSEMRGKFSRGRGRATDGSHQQAYEMWKSERNQIDQDRINRQKTAGGEWKREWDKEKVTGDVGDDRPPITGQGRYFQDIPYRRDKIPLESFIIKDGGHQSTPHQIEKNKDVKETIKKKKIQDSASSFTTQVIIKDGGHQSTPHQIERNKDVKETIKKKKIQDSASSFTTQDIRPQTRSPKTTRNERTVKDLGTSLQVSLKNDNVVSTPVQRVKVTPKSVAGTGRVGPRQQARMSYSSQSEDEAAQRANTERKVLSKRQSKKSEDHHASNVRTAQASVPSQGKEMILDALEVKENDASKPPLPPTSDSKIGDGMERPKRQRIKPLRQKGFRDTANKTAVSKSDSKESSDDTKEISESGDDGWEDVTTTSGTESMSEDATQSLGDNTCEMSPESKVTEGSVELSNKLSSSEEEAKVVEKHIVGESSNTKDGDSIPAEQAAKQLKNAEVPQEGEKNKVPQEGKSEETLVVVANPDSSENTYSLCNNGNEIPNVSKQDEQLNSVKSGSQSSETDKQNTHPEANATEDLENTEQNLKDSKEPTNEND